VHLLVSEQYMYFIIQGATVKVRGRYQIR